MRRSRTRTGCLTCREEGYKCDEQRPYCGRCVRLEKVCKGYGLVLKWQACKTPSSSSSSSSSMSPPPSTSKTKTATPARRRSLNNTPPAAGNDDISLGSATPHHQQDTEAVLAVNPSYIPPDIDPETRRLLHHWTVTLAAVVSMAPTSNQNPFLVHLTPMLFRSAALRFAISAMAASHLAVLHADGSMETTASRHRLRAVSSLRQTIQTHDPELSLAAILMLQVSDRLFTADNKVNHLSGAKAVITQGGGLAGWAGSSAQFLLGVSFYHDVLSSVSRGTTPLLDLGGSVPSEGLPCMQELASVLGLVGTISRMQGQAPELDRSQAHAVEEALEASIMGTAGDGAGLDDIGHTTRAYRHAAFIYLYRVWLSSGAPHPSTAGHAERCLYHLSHVPITSPLASAHAWPLWTAGCESVDGRARGFVRDRLDAMFSVRHLPSLRRMKDDMEEVWLTKDAQRSLTGMDDVDCVRFILENRQREADLA